MNDKGQLQPGDVFKTPTGDVWWVESTSPTGALCYHLSGHFKPITGSKKGPYKGQTKIVRRHLSSRVFSLTSIVELVDPGRLDSVQLRRRITMARKEGSVAETPAGEGTQATETRQAPPPRVASKYKVTDKAPEKELRGQAKETYEALKAAHEPLTAKQVADKCVYTGSRQDKERVAAFYIAAFKKKGLIVVVPDAA